MVWVELTNLVQEVELRDVGDLSVQQLVGDVEDPLLDGHLDRHRHFIRFIKTKKFDVSSWLVNQPIM